jgi:hypothetical protein
VPRFRLLEDELVTDAEAMVNCSRFGLGLKKDGSGYDDGLVLEAEGAIQSYKIRLGGYSTVGLGSGHTNRGVSDVDWKADSSWSAGPGGCVAQGQPIEDDAAACKSWWRLDAESSRAGMIRKD